MPDEEFNFHLKHPYTELIEAWLRIEEQGRRLASERTKVADDEDQMWMGKLELALTNMLDRLHDEFNDPWAPLPYELVRAVKEAWLKSSWCREEMEPKATCYFDKMSGRPFYDLNEEWEAITGKGCTWLLPEPILSSEEHTTLEIAKLPYLKLKTIPPRTYNLSMAENDLTACFHRLIEHFQDALKTYRQAGKCMWQAEAVPSLVEGCQKWDEATEYMNQKDLYIKDDYGPLKARITGKEANVTVGSAPGHTAHVNLDNTTIQYHDTDKEVNLVMKDLLDSAGLDCEVWKMTREMDSGVLCRNLNESNVGEAMKMLSAATSMDYRLQRPKNYWLMRGGKGYYHPEVAETFGNCDDVWADPSGAGKGLTVNELQQNVEVCAVKDTLKNVPSNPESYLQSSKSFG